MAKITAHQLKGCYDSFWTRFKGHCGKHGLSLAPRNEFPFVFQTVEAGFLDAVIDIPIYLQAWPENGESDAQKAATAGKSNPSTPILTTKKIDIIVFGSERIDVQTHLVRRSNIHVEYYTVETGAKVIASPRELIRYDFKAPPRSAHPLFHAQRTAAPCNGQLQDILNKNTNIRWNDIRKTDGWSPLDTVKIPTAYMSAISSLVSICADHNSREQFDAFYADLLQNHHKAPKADASAMDNHYLRPRASWESLAWYPHKDQGPLNRRAGRKKSAARKRAIA